MEIAITHDANTRTLHVVYSGEFSLSEAEVSFLDILGEIMKQGTRKVLIDGRGIVGEPGAMERFLYGKFAADSVNELQNQGLSYAPQFAYTMVPPVLDPQRFGETVAANRGMYVKAFDNVEDARRWLSI